MSDLAHLGPVEIFTPRGEESLAFFVDVMGMEIEAQDGPSTYLRCAHDYQRWSVKLTASDTNGIGVLGLRAFSPEALERRVAAVEAHGLGEGWTDGDLGRGPSYGIEPGGNRIEVTTGGRFVYAPDEPCVVWTEEERKQGQAWGVKTVPSFHTYGTPVAPSD